MNTPNTVVPVPQPQADAYNALNPADREVIDGMILQGVIATADNAQSNSREAVPADFANNITLQAQVHHQATTSTPAATQTTEAQIELARASLSEQAPELLPRLRETYMRVLTTLSQYGVNAHPGDATRLLNEMIAIDGDQFDVRAEWPAIRAELNSQAPVQQR